MPPDLGPEIEKSEILNKHGELLMDFNGCLISGRIGVGRGQLSRPPCLFRISLFSISGPRSGGTYIGRPLDAASILFIVQYSAKKSSFPG